MADLPEQIAQALGVDGKDLSDHQRTSAQAIGDYIGGDDPAKTLAEVRQIETRLGTGGSREQRLERVYRYVKLRGLMH
jgi:hypothetical protein